MIESGDASSYPLCVSGLGRSTCGSRLRKSDEAHVAGVRSAASRKLGWHACGLPLGGAAR